MYFTQMIKHLVLSGAGTNGIIQLGLFEYLVDTQIIQLQHIKTIYSTSAGTILAILFVLGIPIADIRDYIIHRPWEKFFDLNFLNLNDTKGIIASEQLYNMVKPFMLAYDIPDTFTLLDLYNKTNIDLHIFTTKLNDMVSVDLNHTTFPDITLCEAITMTASLPIVFTPVLYKDEYYIDGGILNNCPIQHVENYDAVLVIDVINDIQKYTPDTTLLNYINIMFLKSLNILCLNETNKQYKNQCKYYYQIKTSTSFFDMNSWNSTFNNIEYRQKLHNTGYTYIKN